MVRRVGLLAPMTHELEPLVRRLGLVPRGEGPEACHEATVGGVTFVAAMTGIGMAPATAATARVIAEGVDHVVVVGIAGGIGPDLGIGDLVVPEAVLHGGTGTRHVPDGIGDHPAAGIVRSGDDFLTDGAELDRLVAEGVVALDMETAAVGAACEAAGVPWSAFRAISDRPRDRLVDVAVWEMTTEDGSADPVALARYLAADPGAAARLSRLADDLRIAVDVAARAAIAACGVDPGE